MMSEFDERDLKQVKECLEDLEHELYNHEPDWHEYDIEGDLDDE
jgi:hypothetical protein